MRKATAVWLVDNTSLTFEQIAEFCGLHELEVQGIADGDVAVSVTGQSPINNGQLTREMIKACETDSKKELELNESIALTIEVKKPRKRAKYIPIARRGDKPDGIAYLLKYFPKISDKQIRKLIGTTTKMIESIRTKEHWNIKEIKPRDPVLLGLCTQSQLNEVAKKLSEEENPPVKKKVKKAKKTKASTKKKTTKKKKVAKKTAKKTTKKKV